MKKILLVKCISLVIICFSLGKLLAQSNPVLDTLQADGHLRIVAPTFKNLLTLVELPQSGFEDALKFYGYKPNMAEAKGTYKIESFQATYNIHKSNSEVEFYFSKMVGTLSSLKTEVKKRFPKSKITGEGTQIQIYEFEEKDALGAHAYMLNIDANNGSSVFISLFMLY